METIIAVPIFMTFFLLLSPWLCWCSSCHYYWSWFDCCCYCCHFCSIVVINTSLFCSIGHLLCIIMFLVLLRLFLCHCCFCCFAVAVFSLPLLMLLLFFFFFLLLLSLLLHGFCCVHCYRCQGGCWCCCSCFCCVVVTSFASLLCPFLWFFDFSKFKLTLNFCNYLFDRVVLFFFILQGIK